MAALAAACARATPAPVAPLPHAFGATPSRPASLAPASPAPSPPPHPSAAESPPLALPAVATGDVGLSGPVELLAASASASWVALCQGEPPAAALVLGSGAGEPIDDLLAHDESGRWVVVAVNGGATLIDTHGGGRTDLSALGADVRRAREDYAAHRSLSFTPDGRHLAYLRRQDGQSAVVVRQLIDGTERAFAPGPGEVFRLRLSPDGSFVTLDVLREDTTGNGKLDWPLPEEAAGKSPCRRGRLPKLRSFAHQGRGDAVVRAALSVPDGKLRDVPELLTPLGASLLLRGADGSLQLERDGKRTPLAPADCAGRVLFADAERGLVLAACAPPKHKKTGKRGVWLFGAGHARDLQRELYETSVDREAVRGVRLVPLYPGSEAALVDLERRELLALPTGSRVLSVSGPTALLWRGNDLYRYDARDGTEALVTRGVAKNPDLLQTGSAVLLSPFVVLDDAAPPLLSPTDHPLALALTGHVLAGSRPDPTPDPERAAMEGPLRWLDARVAAPDGSPR